MGKGRVEPDSQATYFSSIKKWDLKIETFPPVFIASLPCGFWKRGEKRKWQKGGREEMAVTSPLVHTLTASLWPFMNLMGRSVGDTVCVPDYKLKNIFFK